MSTLAGATWTEVTGRGLVGGPVGSIAPPGPHLRLQTDPAWGVAPATVAADQTGAWVAPALSYGSSGEHQSFAGTASVGTDALQHQVVELVRSLTTWVGAVLLVNAHGGNVAALRAAVDQLVAEDRQVAWVACATEAVDLHAGRTETSLMLYLRPDDVRLERAVAGTTQPLDEILPAMMAGGVAAVSANGVLGDPTGASADEGAAVLAAMVADVVAAAERLTA